MNGQAPDGTARVAGIFGYLADRDFRGYSPLYEHLAREIAADELIPALVTRANSRNHAPILFFACVHDQVLADPNSDLAQAYAAVAGGADPVEAKVWPLLRELVADRGDEIDHMLRTRHVQTNEVGRSAALAPALIAVGHHFGQPIGLIEIGCSAGLNLLVDQFQITYSAGDGQVVIGPDHSTVRLGCEVHGTRRPPLPDPEDERAPLPAVIASRLGIDRRPVDVTDAEAVRWLQACLWPDQGPRRQHLDAAVALAATDPPPLWSGDAVELIDEAVATVGDDVIPCVFSTWVLAYLSSRRRAELHQRMDAIGRERPLAWITAEYEANVSWLGQPDRRAALDQGQLPTRLGLEMWPDGVAQATSLAWMHAHGQWLEWLDDPSPA